MLVHGIIRYLISIKWNWKSIHTNLRSTADPWTFASLSFDGRILISHVNREHKYALMKL